MSCKHCGAAPPSIRGAAICENTLENNWCNVRCRCGSISDSTNCSCKPSGDWVAWQCPIPLSKPLATCPPVTCESCPRRVPSSTAHSTGCTFGIKAPAIGLECDITCNSGYRETSTLPHYQCVRDSSSNDPQWKVVGGSESARCESVECPAEAPQNCPHCKKCSVGRSAGTLASCTGKCDTNYTRTSLIPAINRYTCGTDGHWSGGSTKCKRLCTGPPVEHAMDCKKAVSCKATCKPGYMPQKRRSVDHVYQYSCNPHGKWHTETPQDRLKCVEICSLCDESHSTCTPGPTAQCVCNPRVSTSSPSWFGDLCNLECNSTMCHHGSECVVSSTAERPNTADDAHSCRCTHGWAGNTCTQQDSCVVPTNPCQHGGECSLDETNIGFNCQCTAGYGGDTCEVSTHTWETISAIVTVICSVPMPLVVKRFRKSLHDLTDPAFVSPDLRENDHQGVIGFLLYLYGVFDLIVDVLLCASLFKCRQWVLFVCSTWTLGITTLLTWYLGYSALRAVGVGRDKGVPPDTESYGDWIAGNQGLASLIVLGSSSRLDSMAILRLRLFGKTLVDFPDARDHRFWFFLKNAGMYHYLVEDLPHTIVSLALLQAQTGAVSRCEPGADTYHLPLADKTIAWLALCLSIGSMLFGVVRKTIQLLAQRVSRPIDGLLTALDGNGQRASFIAAVARVEAAGMYVSGIESKGSQSFGGSE
jgi:hypothetical protein